MRIPAISTRRDFLRATATGAASLLASRYLRQDSRTSITARFVGDAFERGHLWLGADPANVKPDQKRRARVVIIGAGVAGACAAWRLTEAGVDDVVVLEVEDVAGGLGRSGLVGSHPAVPYGGSTLPLTSASSVVGRLMLRSGLWPENASKPSSRVAASGAVVPSMRILRNGDWSLFEITEDSLEPLVRLEASDDETVLQWLERNRIRNQSVEIWSRMRFGARMDTVSAAALMLDLEARVLGKHQNDGAVIPVEGGFAQIVKPLLAPLRERVLYAHVALRVDVDEGRARVRAVNALTARVTELETDAVIFAVPSIVTRKIAPKIAERDTDLVLPETTPWLVTALLVRRFPRGFDPAAMWHIPAKGPSARIGRVVGEGGSGVLIDQRPFSSPYAMPARLLVRELDAERARDYVLADLATIFPDIRECAEHAEILRIGHGGMRPVPGILTRIAPRLRAPLPPLFPSGADGAGLPAFDSAADGGVRAAEDVLAHLRIAHESWR